MWGKACFEYSVHTHKLPPPTILRANNVTFILPCEKGYYPVSQLKEILEEMSKEKIQAKDILCLFKSSIL